MANKFLVPMVVGLLIMAFFVGCTGTVDTTTTTETSSTTTTITTTTVTSTTTTPATTTSTATTSSSTTTVIAAGLTWSQITPLTDFSSRDSGACVTFQNKIYLLGGFVTPQNETVRTTNEVLYSSDGLTWTNYLATWPAREKLSATVHNGEIWIYGGSSSSNSYNDVWKSSNGTDWTLVGYNTSIGSRELASLVSFDNQLWIAGGELDDNSYCDIWSSSNGLTWEQKQVFPGSTGGLNILNNNLTYLIFYINGGAQTITCEVQTSTDGLNWQNTSATFPSQAGFPANTLVQGDKIYLLGLENIFPAEAYLNKVYSSVDAVNWTLVTAEAPWVGRDRAYVTTMNQQLWLIAGRQKQAALTYKDLWVSPPQ